jgi:DNA-binding PadR family transcriptional regulator
MPKDLRLSHQSLRILKVFLAAFSENVRAELAGSDVMRAAQVSSGTLYPVLLRLERAGMLKSRWEDARPEDLGRPRRRFYAMTPAGAARARKALDELSSPLPAPLPEEA